MPAKRELSMRQLRHLLRLHHDGVSAREIGRRLGVARSSIQDNLKRAAAPGACRRRGQRPPRRPRRRRGALTRRPAFAPPGGRRRTGREEAHGLARAHRPLGRAMAPVGRGGGRGCGREARRCAAGNRRSRRGLRRRRSAGALRRRRGGRDDATDPSVCAADFRVGCRTRRALARRRCFGAGPEMAVRAASARRASLPGQRAARGALRRRG